MTGLAFTHPQVQRLRRLAGRRSARLDERAFVVEGPTLVGEAVAAGWAVEAQYVAPGSNPVDGAGPVHELGPGVLERVATTETPQPVLAVVRMPDATSVAADATFVLVVDRLGDPGNCGTILRSAEAAGADAVVLTAGSVDPFNPKAVRASAGALFRVPVHTATFEQVAGTGLTLLGSSSHRGLPYTDVDLTRPVALVVGNEAHGLAPDAPVHEWLTIPHHGRTESLNVAMAATVLCFEVARQRRARPDTVAPDPRP